MTLAPRARVRHRDPLPLFSASAALDPALAWVDRVVVKLPRLSMDASHTASATQDRWPSAGRIFTGGRRGNQWLFNVKRGWLFSGTLRVTKTAPSPGRYPAELELHLNPTRFLAHNLGKPNWRALTAAEQLASCPQKILSLQAQSLARHDNMIPEVHLAEAAALNWPSISAYYLQTVVDFILGSFDDDRHAHGSPALRLDVDELHVRQSEIYWEQRHPHASDLARYMSVELPTLLMSGSHTSHGLAEHTVRLEANELSAHVNLGAKNVTFSLYAKTDTRVRMEVRHNANFKRTYPKAAPALDGISGADILRASLEFVTLKSIDRATPLLSAFHRQQPVRSTITEVAREIWTVGISRKSA